MVIIQPTPFCNIDCRYCYLANRSERTVISLDTVNAIARFLQDVPKRAEPLSIAWHAGEPLVVKRHVYEQAFRVLSDNVHAFGVRQHFQTNGTLIDDHWCEFFLRHNVQVGLSIDGPKAVHDAARVTRGRRGTFDKVMTAIARLKKHGVKFTVISVITPKLLAAIDETVEFFVRLGATRLAFNVEEVEAAHLESSLFNADLREAVTIFFDRLYQLQEDQPSLHVRELDSMRDRLRAPINSHTERSTNQVGGVINFDVDGNISTFSPELLGTTSSRYGRIVWGNAHKSTWHDVLGNPDFARVRDDIAAGVERCARTCEYFTVCGGGDPSNKLAEHGTFDATETHCCRLHLQTVADVVIKRLEAKFKSSSLNP